MTPGSEEQQAADVLDIKDDLLAVTDRGQLTNTLTNLVGFQAVWFMAVVGAGNGSAWLGPIGLGLFLISHYFFSDTAKADYKLAAMALLVGLAVETTLMRTGLIAYTHSIATINIAPLWILILWPSFALTMNGCLRWLQGRWWLAAALGLVGGPLSYYAGFRLGAASAEAATAIVLLIIAIVYAIITPLFLAAARRLAVAMKTP